jgi:predicted dithiol-disulfide oxidoreductase (DUF899 family)
MAGDNAVTENPVRFQTIGTADLNVLQVEGAMGADHKVVSHEEWVKARTELLAEEKEITRRRDILSQRRRDLPWVRVEKDYVFDGPNGRETLAQLFGPCRQLVIYHFMFDPGWGVGCKSCSWWADNFERNVVHLTNRDVTLIAVSRAPLGKLEAFKRRMSWNFKWVSSEGSDFNYDFNVSFTADEQVKGEAYYNYAVRHFAASERPGISVFYKDRSGAVFHTYSCYGRGLDMLNAGYHYLDLVTHGRDEEGLPYNQSWVRHRDSYGAPDRESVDQPGIGRA